MLKKILVFIICLAPLMQYSQDFSESWTGYFSYLDIKDISQGTNKIYGASENAIFIYDTQTKNIKELSTIHGLSGEIISTINYVEEKGLLLIGFEEGLIQIYDELNNDFVFVIDIINKLTIPADKKRITHFNVYDDYVYISTGFGVLLYDIAAFEFGDTYFLGLNGAQSKVNQTCVFEGYLYAATDTGLYRGDLDNSNLISFEEWENISLNNWIGVQVVGNSLFGASIDNRVYEINNNTSAELTNYSSEILGFRSFRDRLVTNTRNDVFVYSEAFNTLAQISRSIDFDVDFTKSTIFENDELYIGTTGSKSNGKPGHGILKTTLNNVLIFEEIHPESPLLNSFFEIKISGKEIWGVHGGYSSRYAWSGGLRRSGISHFLDEEWNNIVYDTIQSKVETPYFLSHISVNPFDSGQVYISSYFSGLIDINNKNIINIYNQDNSTINPFINNFYLTSASNYNNDVLWVLNGRTDRPLNKFLNGSWTSFDFSGLIADPQSNLGFSNIIFDDFDNLFFGSFNYGLIGFNENNGTPLLKNISGEEKNMPSDIVNVVTLDKRNQLWIGTNLGLRVLYNISNFFDDDNIRVEEIIIEEDGVAKELLFQQSIVDIEVDGSNNKWIGTADSGLFYFSSDGQKTIFHFTKDNSPLPSNSINDVLLDEVNGVVYIATSRGLVSFLSGGSGPLEDLESTFVYPNPVRPTFNIVDEKVKIKDISENVNIKITDIEGNLVAEAQSRTNQRYRGFNLEIDGGTAYWNGKNMANNIVASGVYLIMLSDLDSFETKVLKLMVVR
ncbi:type IX secretion system anionic LPS delivery protein PorZ [Flavivirga algicola]|uniref:ABC transporter substrate-binding protein n=1 Tax=Flavivirga algicola TaxID=2729136 RepID=A0ABX1RXK5_9FLAO|nr:ABC transporter substrate-binding protein [Flavivirga algicola]NMH87408.1 ABC transporter substrate-binding protein [Flavivirga algicola]